MSELYFYIFITLMLLLSFFLLLLIASYKYIKVLKSISLQSSKPIKDKK